jgi:hypothetical protein
LKLKADRMTKEIFLFRGTGGESYHDFSARLKELAAEVTGKNGHCRVRLVWTAEPPPALSVIPFRKQKAATLSLVNHEPNPVEFLASQPGFAGGYRVTEALPVSYRKTWDDGEHTPGMCLLTLFNPKKGLGRDEFIDRWHNSHTPLSLKIHPLWNYSRNVVEEAITVNAEKFGGIVEEQVRTDADLLNPFRFFGNPLVIVQRMIAVYTDTRAFLDYGGIETYMAREVIVKS